MPRFAIPLRHDRPKPHRIRTKTKNSSVKKQVVGKPVGNALKKSPVAQ